MSVSQRRNFESFRPMKKDRAPAWTGTGSTILKKMPCLVKYSMLSRGVKSRVCREALVMTTVAEARQKGSGGSFRTFLALHARR